MNSIKTKQIEASQHFETLGASKPQEAPIVLRFKTEENSGLSTLWDSGSSKTLRSLIFWGFNCKSAGKLQKTQMAQSLGSLGRPALKSRLRPLSILRLWGLPNLERPQSFRGSRLKQIEASQHFGTLGAPKH